MLSILTSSYLFVDRVALAERVGVFSITHFVQPLPNLFRFLLLFLRFGLEQIHQSYTTEGHTRHQQGTRKLQEGALLDTLPAGIMLLMHFHCAATGLPG